MALTDKVLEIYQGHFRRSFVHVEDVSRAIIMAIDKYEKMRGEVYNVGDESMNYTKLEVRLGARVTYNVNCWELCYPLLQCFLFLNRNSLYPLYQTTRK